MCGGPNASAICASLTPRGNRCGTRSRACCRSYSVRKRTKLRLVGHDPTDVFDDLDKLRADLAAPLRRERIAETFARIPHDRAIELYRQKIGEPRSEERRVGKEEECGGSSRKYQTA